MRSVADQDAVWVSCVKAVPTVLIFGPWLLVIASRGQRILPPIRHLGELVAAAVFAQLAGNVLFQWSLGVLGLAIVVPLTLGTLIFSSAVMGNWLLDEPIGRRAVASMIILVVAIVILSWGSQRPETRVDSGSTTDDSAIWRFLGVAAALTAGFSYAVLGVVIRKCVAAGGRLSTTLVIVGLAGVICLGVLSIYRMGSDEMWATSEQKLGLMLGAGLCNAIAFCALTKALQLTGVVYVNLLNATQVAMAAVAGVTIFGEQDSLPFWIGVSLTGLGVLIMKQERRPREPAPAVAE